MSENGLAQASARQKFDIIATIGAADDVKMHRAKLDEDMAEKYRCVPRNIASAELELPQ